MAKLNVDAMDRSIVSNEIRFSSAAAVGFAVFVLLAGLLFSSAPAAAGKAGAPLPVLALFGVFAIFAVYINMRMLRSRMQKLGDEALVELGEM